MRLYNMFHDIIVNDETLDIYLSETSVLQKDFITFFKASESESVQLNELTKDELIQIIEVLMIELANY